VNRRQRAIVALVLVVAVVQLAESWHAAARAAANGGRPWPWAWPAGLEAFLCVLVLAYWDARAAGDTFQARVARVMLAVVAAVAALVQILDAPATALGWLTAGWTPVVLVLSVEFAMSRIYRTRKEPEPDRAAPVPDHAAEPEPTPQPTQALSRSGPAPREPTGAGRARALQPARARRVRELARAGMGVDRVNATLRAEGLGGINRDKLRAQLRELRAEGNGGPRE
jgi:hypothetical protein